MSADEEFGRLVGDRLRHEVSDIHADRELAGAVRRRQSRRTWTIRASIGAPLVAAAAAVAVVAATAGSTPARDSDTQAAPPNPLHVENLAHVQDMTLKALGSVNEYVIHEKNVLESGYLEYWTDRSTHRYRADSYSTLVQPPQGSPSKNRAGGTQPETGPLHLTHSIAGTGTPGDMHYVSVDFERKTWHTDHDTSQPPPLEVPDILDANALKQAIDEGRMELIGTETVGDRETHHLRLFATQRGYQIDLWVDSTSYLPVRETSTVIDGPAKPVMTSDYDWLPRNDENLAKLELSPPPDFVKE
ncbi:hypothetical protein [Actinophytocola oryzae]|uniref:Uncharacterized protein n=1 Tax=Actinophytocola oryzae TaxID=502181 RepID=A0A4R7UYH9_9PSEU|nr:hypothetical protein [Actinophytocola oryzae]TDV40136.1 hypothetical protein CLV71_124155 [Actinophytocola oryzae]